MKIDSLETLLQSELMDIYDAEKRLVQVFKLFGFTVKAKPCAGMKGLIEEGEEVIKDDAEGALLDQALIGAAQRVEHYEMAAYGTVRTMAEQLGNSEAASLLEETLNEEKDADSKLTEVAQQLFEQAGAEAEGEEEETEGKAARRQSKRPRTKTSRA